MNLKYLLVFLKLLLLFPALLAQGLILDDDRYQQLPRQPLYGDGGKSEATALEGIYKIDLKPYCPRPMNQGQVASCTGWSTGYGAMTIAYAVQQNWENDTKTINDKAFSALFLYNQARADSADCSEGSHIQDALDLLEQKGNVLSKDFDKRPSNCKRKPTVEELALAKQYQIKDWLTLFAPEDPNRVKIDKTKLSLAAKKPVIVAMRLRNNFINLGSDNKFWLPMLGDTAPAFYHAMVVVGFDDGKGAFEVMNSWGPTWGNQGFFWVKYEDYARHTRYAYQMTLQTAPAVQTIVTPKPKPVPAPPASPVLYGTVQVRYPTDITETGITFQNASFTLQNGIYELSGETSQWPLGKLFQLVVNNMAAGTYLYAFSFDAEQAIRVHWPRDGKLDEKFDGINESAVITNGKVQVVVPGEQAALRLDKPGFEYICLLFSKDPLKDINAILTQVKSYNPAVELPKRVQETLKKRLVSAAQIRFLNGAVQFETADVKGSVVPVFLRIPVR